MIAISCSESFKELNAVLQNRCWYFVTRLPKPLFGTTRCFLMSSSTVS